MIKSFPSFSKLIPRNFNFIWNLLKSLRSLRIKSFFWGKTFIFSNLYKIVFFLFCTGLWFKENKLILEIYDI